MARNIRGRQSRKHLSKAIKYGRRHDIGKGHNPYNTDRNFSNAPFKERFLKDLNQFLDAGRKKVSILDKGAGTGKMLAQIKNMDPERIVATAVSLSRTVEERHKQFIDKVKIGSGIRVKHEGKYDLIYDCFGEDYFLHKDLYGKSIANSLAHLKKGGVLYTVIPLVHAKSAQNLTVKQGQEFFRELKKKRPKLKIWKKQLRKRIGFIEYVDLVVRIEKG